MANTGKTDIHGTLVCELRERGLYAVLKLTSSDAFQQWDLSDMVKFLADSGVSEGYSPSGLEKILGQLGKSPAKAVEIEVARGLAPEAPQPEKPEWLDLPIPDRFRLDAETVIPKAGPPVIYAEKNEKVKVEKTIQKKAPFPFMPPREERVVLTEIRTTRERVYLDTTVEATGWVSQGQKIARIDAAKPGIPGKSVAGGLIMVEALLDPLVYAGGGVIRKANELTAARTGYLRRGKNWAEVLAFQPHVWEVRQSADKASCLLDFSPGDQGARVPPGQEILECALKLGLDRGSLLMPAQVDQLLKESLSSGKALREVPLSGSQDSFCELRIREDKLKAVLNLRKGRGTGRPLVLKEVGAAIKAAKLKDPDYEKIKQDLLAFYRGEKLELDDYVLAEGKAPTAGEARGFEWSVRFLEDKTLAANKAEALSRSEALGKIASIGEFPMQAVQAMGLVEKEQRIVMLGPPSPGQPGQDVHGAVIQPLTGPEPKFKLHEGLEQKQNVIIATAPGLLDRGELDGLIHLRVRPHKDCEITVNLAASRMEACLTLYLEEGAGAPLTREKVDAAIAKAGVTTGLLDGAVAEAVLMAMENGRLVDQVIARGVAPQSGAESSLRFLISLASGKAVSIRGDGRADFRTRDTITVTAKGTRIAELIPPSAQPQEGCDVTGKAIPVKAGPSQAITPGPNIESVQENGKIVLVATVDGEVIYDEKGRRIEIVPTHTVKGNLDMATGNIKFPGTVTISGSVASGFFVVAGGDILVGESVEAALLSAEGNIGIKQGVKGMGKAVLRSRKEVQAGFVEQTTILAVGDVKMRTACMFCTVKTNGQLALGPDKGHLIGGSIKARAGVAATNIGSERGGKLRICFGQDYLVGDQIEIEEAELRKLGAAAAAIDTNLRQAERSGDKAALDGLRAEKLKNMKIVEKRTLRLFTLREKFEEHFPSEVRVRGTVFPGVILESHGRFHEVTSPRKAVVFTFNRETGRIEESQPEKNKDKD